MYSRVTSEWTYGLRVLHGRISRPARGLTAGAARTGDDFSKVVLKCLSQISSSIALDPDMPMRRFAALLLPPHMDQYYCRSRREYVLGTVEV